MWRTCSLIFLALTGCGDYAADYSRDVQNQMIAADDAQDANIVQLKAEVNQLDAKLNTETALRAGSDQQLDNITNDLDREIHANANYAAAVYQENGLKH